MENSFPVKLARKTIEEYIVNNIIYEIQEEIPDKFMSPAGVFVSLKMKGMLRGCIGTFAPTTNNIAQEIIRNAIEASTRDPRFPPIAANEIGELVISVDILSPPEEVGTTNQLDSKKYGVIVKAGGKRGLLLPDLPGVTTPEQQIDICRQKAGIEPNEEVELYRFKVERYH